MTRSERLRLMAECHARLAELLRVEASELDTQAAAPRKVRRAPPPVPATARGIAMARQAIERHTRAGVTTSKRQP